MKSVSPQECKEVCLRANLNLSRLAKEEYTRRGVTESQIEEFKLGSAFSKKLFRESDPDTHDMLVLPLTNVVGDIRGFQVRAIVRSVGGYVDYFVDRKEPVLFGLGQAAPHMYRKGEVCLAEGAFDVLPIQTLYPSIIGTLTAHVSPQTIRLLSRLVSKIWVAYDNDSAGEDGLKRIRKQYGEDFEVASLKLPKGVKDPGTLIEKQGPKGVESYAQPMLLGAFAFSQMKMEI